MTQVAENVQNERIATKADGPLTYKIEQIHLHLGVGVLLVSALVVIFLPDRWFDSGTLQLLAEWARSISAKVESDSKLLESRGLISSGKYAVFVLYCGSITGLATLIMCPITHLAINASSQPLTWSKLRFLWKGPVALLVVGYFAIFDVGMLWSNASRAREIANSPLLFLWTALLWGMLSMVVAGFTILLSKLVKHGWPKPA